MISYLKNNTISSFLWKCWVYISTASSMNVQGVSLSTASSMNVQGVTISTASSMDVQGVSPSTASSMNVLGVSLYPASSMDVLCRVYPFFKCRTVRHPVSPVPE